jgi:hypothetical protein
LRRGRIGVAVVTLRAFWPLKAIAAINALWTVAAFGAVESLRPVWPVWTPLWTPVLAAIEATITLLAEALTVTVLRRAILRRAYLALLAILGAALRPVIKITRTVIPVRAVVARPAIITHGTVAVAIASFARREVTIAPVLVTTILTTAIRALLTIRTRLTVILAFILAIRALRPGRSAAFVQTGLRFLAANLGGSVALRRLVAIFGLVIIRLEARARHHTSLARHRRAASGFSSLLFAIG